MVNYFRGKTTGEINKYPEDQCKTLWKKTQPRFFKRKTAHFLSASIKQKRLSRSRDLLAWLENEEVEQLVFSDEKLFNIEQATKKQNDQILAPNSSSILENICMFLGSRNPLYNGLGRYLRK